MASKGDAVCDPELTSESGEDGSICTDVENLDWMYVVKICDKLPYRIPSFKVLTVQLRHVIAEVEDTDNGDIVRKDVLFRDDDCLNTFKPGTRVHVLNSCTVNAADFSQVTFNLLDSQEVLIVWKWEVEDEGSGEQEEPSCEWESGSDDSTHDKQWSSDSSNHSSDEDPHYSSDDVDDNSPSGAGTSPTVMHTVKFKCIGVTLDTSYQSVLRRARDIRSARVYVPVRLQPEPHNPVDAKAIAFVCEVDGKWQRIGYVVTQVLDEVHDALQTRKIISVRFAWIKYISDWTRSGPGYFAGIYITRHGNWSSNVTFYASTR